MFWYFIYVVIVFLLDLLQVFQLTLNEKDLEILFLRQHLAILRRQKRGPTITPMEKLVLAVLVQKLKTSEQSIGQHLNRLTLVFQPETVLHWHRKLVRRKWTYSHRENSNRGGRPKTDPEIEALVLRLARENLWGAGKLQGELKKLGYTIGETTLRDILRRHSFPNAPTRKQRSGNWRAFLKHYRQQTLACDFFTVETLWLQTLYVFFFIELGTRRVHIASVTPHPTSSLPFR